MTSRTARWLSGTQRLVLLVTLASSVLLFLPGLTEPVMLPKATVIVAGAVVVALLALARTAVAGQPVVPSSRLLALLAALIVAMAVATLTSPSPGTSAIGRLGRYGGAVEYGAYGVLLVTVAVLYRTRPLTALTRTLLLTFAGLLVYGVVQVLGRDPVGWSTGSDAPLFSTMGNTNFASAYAGIMIPIALSVALSRATSVSWRVVSGMLVVGGFAYTVVLQAIQGPVIAVVGSSLVLAALVGRPGRALRRAWASRRPLVLLTAVLAGLGGLAAVPLVTFFVADLPRSLHQRTQLWSAAWRMFLDHPVTGVGLDGYGYYFLAYRPASHAQERGLAFADAAHQVPLAMFAHGGVLLGLSYAAFVAAVGVVLVRGLRRTSGEHQLALAGYGGAWLAYQLQSLVSLDVPPIALLQFVTAGAVLALASPPRLVTLGPTVRVPAAQLVAAGLVLALVVPLVGAVLRPLRADVAAAVARQAAGSRDLEESFAWSRRAVALVPFEPSYRRAFGQRLARAGNGEAGLRELERAAELESGSITYARDVVALADELDEEQTELRWYGELAERNPYDVKAVLQEAENDADTGDNRRAQALYELALQAQPNNVRALRGLAGVLVSTGDVSAARNIYERLLEASPDDQAARAWLDQQGAEGQ
jgi:putative inorganic carbon (HCO3(-)) transporter